MKTTKNPAVPTDEMLKEWAEDTDSNNHTEVRVKIAKWAYENAREKTGTDNLWNLRCVFEACYEMKKIHIADKSINRIQWSRLAITNNLFDLIEREYGAKTRKLIENCL